jgi:Pel9A-like, right handed beta helix region/Protein of unknown function (DUF1565)
MRWLAAVVGVALAVVPAQVVGVNGAAAGPLAGMLVVATNGNDADAGTVDRPLLTIQKAVDLARPGDTISLRAGRYAPTKNVQVTHSGTATARITMTSFPGEHAIIDGEQMPDTPAPLGSSIPNGERGAIHLEASFWTFSDLEIVNGPYAIFGRNGGNNVFLRLSTHDNYESGLHLQGTTSNNQIINLDSFMNRDPRKNGESADGLAIKEGSGTGNVVRGARLWNNVDDGFDAWEFLSPIVIENSVAWGNGVNRWNFPNFAGDGNGFKLGGGDTPIAANHTVRNSIAFSNTAGGFVDNKNPGSLNLDHSTAWHNTGTGFDTEDSHSNLTRNLSVSNGIAVKLGSATGSGNSWNLGGTWNNSSVQSTNSAVITGPRLSDGTIPHTNFLVPNDNADLGARF